MGQAPAPSTSLHLAQLSTERVDVVRPASQLGDTRLLPPLQLAAKVNSVGVARIHAEAKRSIRRFSGTSVAWLWSTLPTHRREASASRRKQKTYPVG